MSDGTCNRNILDIRIRRQVDEWSVKARATRARFPGRVDSPYYCNNSARLTVLDAWSPSFNVKTKSKLRSKKVTSVAQPHAPPTDHSIDTCLEDTEGQHIDEYGTSSETRQVEDDPSNLTSYSSSTPISPTSSIASLEGISAQMNSLEIIPSSRSQSLESHAASEALHSHQNTAAASDRSLSNDTEDVADVISLLVRAPDSPPLSRKAAGKRKHESDLITTLPDLSSPTSSTSSSNSIGVFKVNILADVLNNGDTRPSKRPKVDSLPAPKPPWPLTTSSCQVKITVLPGPTPGTEIIEIDDSSDEECLS